MSETISINVIIADRTYPMKIVPADEENVRKAVRMINEKIKEYQGTYAATDKQDYLAMCALTLAVENLTKKEAPITINNVDYSKLEAINSLLDSVLK